MSIFADHARNYFELGFNVIPTCPKEKKPLIGRSWQVWCEKPIIEKTFEIWESIHPDANIGLTCGKANGICVLDFDLVHEKAQKYEATLKGIIEPSPLEKVGKKGWSKFYRWTGQTRGKIMFCEGGVFADILGSSSQTVIPPSFHHQAGKPYIWTSDQTLEDFKRSDMDSLPILSDENIEDIRTLASLNSREDIKLVRLHEKGRHLVIFGKFLTLSRQAQNKDELCDLLLEYDKEMHHDHKKGLYFNSTAGKSALQSARYDVGRWVQWKQAKQQDLGRSWDVGKMAVSSKDNFADYVQFFDEQTEGARLDLISRQYMQRDSGVWTPVVNRVRALRSLANSFGLNRSHVEDNLDRYIADQDPELLIDIPEWDGVDHVREMVKSLTVRNVSSECVYQLFCEWFSCMIGRIYNSSVQNKLIILKGSQGVGKDTFIDALCSGLGDYFSSIDITHQERENFMAISTLICANISEFDRTSKASVSQIKDLITRSRATFRSPYERAAKTHQLRCSFISSCNVDDILRDHTGNRRYVIFDVDDIDWNYSSKIGPQLLAQAVKLNADGFKASEDALSEMDIYIKSQTPDDPEQELIDDYDEMIQRKWLGNGRTQNEWVRSELRYELGEMCKSHGISDKKLCMALKRTGRTKRPRGTTLFVKKGNDADKSASRCTSMGIDALQNVANIVKKREN